MTDAAVSLSDAYSIEVRRSGTHRNLVLIFSHSSKHHFRTIPFDADVISIADVKDHYFTRSPESLTNYLLPLLKSYRHVLAIGTSKGGHGALYQAQVLARASSKKITVLVFSPITGVSDNKSDLKFPSYLGLLAAAKSSDEIRINLQRATNAVTSPPPKNLTILCVHGSDHACDRSEAQRLTGAHYRVLPMRHHESIVPFLCDTTDRTTITRTVLAVRDKATTDADVAFLMKNSGQEAMVEDIASVPKQPTLGEVCAAVLKDKAYTLFPTVKREKPWQVPIRFLRERLQ